MLILGADKFLYDAGERAWQEMEDIHIYPNSYDICVLGPSTAMTNISHQELYEQYGIAGISLAEPLQPLYMGKHALEEILRYQSPSVVFLDTSPMFYSEEVVSDWTHDRENYITREFLDGISSPSVRWRALLDARFYNKDIGVWDYLRLGYTHENWKNIAEDGLAEKGRDESPNGNLVLMGRADGFADADLGHAEDYTQEARAVNEKALGQIAEMADMCRDSGTELILVTEKLFLPRQEHDVVAKIAKECGIAYLDINDKIEEIGFSYSEDLADSVHFNLSGAIKWSHFIGDYVSENYEIVDKRKDPSYKRYEENSALYHAQKDSLSGSDFREYLAHLSELDQEEHIIFLSVYDDMANSLMEEDMIALRHLGLETDLMGKGRSSYAAVIHDGLVQEAFALEEKVTITGNINGLYYKVISGGLLGGKQACIELNDTDYMQKGRGFNFVVYHIGSGEVVDSVFFDTHAYENPRQGWEIREDFRGRRVSFAENSFHEYLSSLASLDRDENMVFISVYDEATASLSDMDAELLGELGLETDLRGRNRCSYAAVIGRDGIQEKFAPEDTVEISGKSGELAYRVTSGGLASGGNAGISLNGAEYIRKGRGFNFVIYNFRTGQVEDSVSFDTYAEENPKADRESTGDADGQESPDRVTFQEYLSWLAELDTGRYMVFISVYDEATTSLTEKDAELLGALGLETDLRGQNRSSFAAVLHDSEGQERFALSDTVEISGSTEELDYSVTSGGLASGGNASIMLNGEEYIRKGRGFNFVIYDLAAGEVIDSVYFDTYAEQNPFRSED